MEKELVIAYLVCAVLFFVCTSVEFKFVEGLSICLKKDKKDTKVKYIIRAINIAVLICLYHFNVPTYLIYIIMFSMFFAKTYYINKIPIKPSLVIVNTIIIPLLAMNLIVTSFVVIIYFINDKGVGFIEAPLARIVIFSIALLCMDLILYKLKKNKVVENFEILFSSLEQLNFLYISTSVISVYLIFFSFADDFDTYNMFFIILICLTAIAIVIALLTVLYYAISMTSLLTIKNKTKSLNTKFYSQNIKQAGMDNYENIDSLTKVFNKKFALNLLEEFILLEMSFCVVYINIKNTTEVNDKFSRETGDEYIKFVAETLVEIFRKSDTMCRLDGDEFIVLVENCDKSIVLEKCNLAMKALKKKSAKMEYTLAFNYGIIKVDKFSYLTEDTILHLAEKEMLKNKKKK